MVMVIKEEEEKQKIKVGKRLAMEEPIVFCCCEMERAANIDHELCQQTTGHQHFSLDPVS
jgi:hypothetical protein